MTCPVCGTVAVAGARFCHHCGARLPDGDPDGFAAERRVVTVLFGDLSDFTAWSEDLDPERVGRLTDRVLAACAQAVTTFGGHVDKLTGDGIMAVFGAPVAHEDDPERAVRAALAMQRAVKRVVDDEIGGGRRLGLRVGVNTGEVVAGVQAALAYTVIGDTVNTAARLSDAAGVGGVFAGAGTARSTRERAAWRALPPLRLKGKRKPVEAFELLGLRDAPGIRAGLGDEAPYVGREAELGRLRGQFAEVAERREPRTVLVMAEAGSGKTRLAAELARHVAAEQGARVLGVRCAAYGEARRLAPLAELVALACGVEPDDDPTRAAEKVRRVAAGRGRRRGVGHPVSPAGVEVLLELLGLPSADAARSSVARLAAGPGAGTRAPEAAGALLSGLATQDPVLVVVDDAHNAVPETMNALGEFATHLAGPILMLVLGRPELVRAERGRRMPAEFPVEVVQLAPLSGAAASRLLRSYLGGGVLGAADEHRLLATAQGNPFYLAELVSLLVEQGRLTGGTRGWRLASGSLDGRLLSSDLAAVLTARIDGLPAGVRAVLRDAAVVGDLVPSGALEALRDNGRSSADELDRARAELVSRRMLRRTAAGHAFVTALMREAAYQGVGKADLAGRHARVARWADAGPVRGLSEPDRDEFVAYHAERALALAGAMHLPLRHDARQVAGLGADALARLAATTLGDGEPARALALLDRATELDDVETRSDAPHRLLRARALLAAGRPGEALSLAQELAECGGSAEVAALMLAGEAHRRLGDPDAAAEAWNAARKRARDAGLAAHESEAARRLGELDPRSGMS